MSRALAGPLSFGLSKAISRPEGVGGLVLPFNAKLGIIGDSIAGQWVFTSSDDYRMMYTHGFPTWANAFSGGRWSHPLAASAGYPGEKATAILVDARIDPIIASGAQAVIVEPGINDINAGDAAAPIIAARAYAVQKFRAAGIMVFNATVTKRFSPATLSAPKEAVRQEVNAAIRAQAAYGVVTVDLDPYLTGSGQVAADGIHPNTQGAYDEGKGIALVIGAGVGAGDPLSLFSSQPFYGINLTLAGTGGFFAGTASGVVANSHTLSDASAGGATVVGSKAADGKQVITVSGNYSGNGRAIEFYNTGSVLKPSELEIIENMLDIELLGDPTAIASVTAFTTIYTAGFAQTIGRFATSTALGLTSPALPLRVADGRLVFRSPQIKLLAGTPAIVANYIQILLPNAAGSTPVALGLKVHGFGAFKSV